MKINVLIFIMTVQGTQGVIILSEGVIQLTVERAIEILDPTHREHYDSIDVVNEACKMGMEALALKKTMTQRIAELEAEVERLLEERILQEIHIENQRISEKHLMNQNIECAKRLSKVKTEAYREFAERLKKTCFNAIYRIPKKGKTVEISEVTKYITDLLQNDIPILIEHIKKELTESNE